GGAWRAPAWRRRRWSRRWPGPGCARPRFPCAPAPLLRRWRRCGPGRRWRWCSTGEAPWRARGYSCEVRMDAELKARLDRRQAVVRQPGALAALEHVACVRVGGPGAFDLVDRVAPLELFARDGQMLHTLLLEPDAKVLADAYVCGDDDRYLVLAEGPTAPELC